MDKNNEPEFDLIFPDAKFFGKLMKCVSVISETFNIQIREEQLNVRVMDSTHAAMVDLTIPKSAMEIYHVLRTGMTRLSLDSTNEKMFKRFNNIETLTLTQNDDFPHKLKLKLNGRYNREYSIPTLESSEDEVPTPKLTFNTKCKLMTKDLKRIIEESMDITNVIQLMANNEHITFKAETELSQLNFQWHKNEENILELTTRELSKAYYDLNYLKTIISAICDVGEITSIQFSTNMPILIEPEFPQDISLKYYVAPRISDDNYESKPSTTTEQTPTEQTETTKDLTAPEQKETPIAPTVSCGPIKFKE